MVKQQTNASSPASGGKQVQLIAIDRIRPGPQQARRVFDEYGLAELADSIRESGVLQPVLVQSDGSGGYRLLAGERRWRAAQRAGLKRLPALLCDDLSEDEAFVFGLVENLQRESLTPLETAEGLKRLAELSGLTHEALGRRIGKSREYVSNALRLLQLVPAVRALVDGGQLSAGHAKVLAALPAAEQPRWAQACVAGRWPVRGLERRLAARQLAAVGVDAGASDRHRLEQRLGDLLGCPVRIDSGSGGTGELRLKFHSWEELDGLLMRVGYREDTAE